MNWYNFILKIKPDGKAFRSILNTKVFFEVLAYGFNLVKEYAEFTINDQIWYVNDNFNPEPWERRFDIIVPEFSTLEERREVVRARMIYPQSQNRLSIDYLQNQLDSAGYSTVIISTNESGAAGRLLHGNNITSTEDYTIGPDDYNSINISGSIPLNQYKSMLLLIMSLKPLETVVYDDVDVNQAIALDDDFTLLLDSTNSLIISVV